MAGLPVINVSGYEKHDLILTKPDSTGKSSASCRSSSARPTMRSSRSRITLVDYDAELETKDDPTYNTTHNEKEFSWLDHLLAVFCIYRRPGKHETTPQYQPTEPAGHEVRLDSPWVLPIYVISTERGESGHLVPKEAKCTIDTGNLQGNIVSRAFVVDVLGYSESSFDKLTKVEEEGGAGVTGHKLIPGGAIYLTWYHNNSTRVFRDMRFLISDHPMYDIIIGARSIQKNNILDVPNLCIGAVIIDKVKAPELNRLSTEKTKVHREIRRVETKIEELEPKKDPKLEKQLASVKIQYRTLEEAYDREQIRLVEKKDPAVKEGNLDQLRKNFETMYGHLPTAEEKKKQ